MRHKNLHNIQKYFILKTGGLTNFWIKVLMEEGEFAERSEPSDMEGSCKYVD
jgi:hypothetical protein